jgi:hypothetical protein
MENFMVYCITAYTYGTRIKPQLYELVLPADLTREELKARAADWLAGAYPDQKLWDVEALPSATPLNPNLKPVNVSLSPPVSFKENHRWLS